MPPIPTSSNYYKIFNKARLLGAPGKFYLNTQMLHRLDKKRGRRPHAYIAGRNAAPLWGSVFGRNAQTLSNE